VGWSRLDGAVAWPVMLLGAVLVTYSSAWALTALLARTPLATALTGRLRVRHGSVVVPVSGL
jgi:hypothetical protein